jgi:hypothetical protein
MKTLARSKRKHGILLPHMVFASIYSACPELFKYLFLGKEGAVEEYWEQSAHTDNDLESQSQVLSSAHSCSTCLRHAGHAL